MRSVCWLATLWVLMLAAHVAASDSSTYPLKPGDTEKSRMRGGWLQLKLNADHCAEIPFATPSGKLRFKVDDEVVQVDANDDGQFGEGEAVKRGGTVKVPIRCGDQPYAYPLMVFGSKRSLALSSTAFLEAQIDGTSIRIFDGNCNGSFSDQAGKPGTKSDTVMIGDRGPQYALGSYVSIGSDIKQFQVLEGGTQLRVTPYEGPLAQLTATAGEGYTVEARLQHKETGLQVTLKNDATTPAMPGLYTINSVRLASAAPAAEPEEAAGPKKAGLQLLGSRMGQLEIKDGSTQVCFGLPLKLDFKAQQTEKGISVKEVWLTGAAGERYRASNLTAEDKEALTTALRSGTETVPGAKLSYG